MHTHSFGRAGLGVHPLDYYYCYVYCINKWRFSPTGILRHERNWIWIRNHSITSCLCICTKNQIAVFGMRNYVKINIPEFLQPHPLEAALNIFISCAWRFWEKTCFPSNDRPDYEHNRYAIRVLAWSTKLFPKSIVLCTFANDWMSFHVRFTKIEQLELRAPTKSSSLRKLRRRSSLFSMTSCGAEGHKCNTRFLCKFSYPHQVTRCRKLVLLVSWWLMEFPTCKTVGFGRTFSAKMLQEIRLPYTNLTKVCYEFLECTHRTDASSSLFSELAMQNISNHCRDVTYAKGLSEAFTYEWLRHKQHEVWRLANWMPNRCRKWVIKKLPYYRDVVSPQSDYTSCDYMHGVASR